MGAPDPHSTGTLIDALKLAGGGVLGAALAAFGKNFFTTGGADAREFREEYRSEIKRLRDERDKWQEEIQELRDDVTALRNSIEDLQVEHAKKVRELNLLVERLSSRNQHYLITRTEARALLNALERRQGLTETPWGNDPLEGGQGAI